jgi:hypothetical protein
MQDEIDALHLVRRVDILGVNAVYNEGANGLMTAGRDLPWLQDTPAADAWTAWAVQWRDVVVLDRANNRVHVYNLTTHDLGNPAHYAALKSVLVAAASRPAGARR